jgi:hypothetical protein
VRDFIGIGLIALLFAGCRPADEPPELRTPETEPLPATAPGPEPTGEAVWAHLEQESYRNWELWPGTSERYPGSEPHGMLLTTYVNDIARDALTRGATPLPDGAIIVKENYMPDGSYDAATVMVKRQGYNPEHNDWFWAKYGPDGAVDEAGRIEMCQACHGANRQQDYLLTPLPQR